MHTQTFSCHGKLKTAKSPLKEASNVPTNPEQEEGDAIPGTALEERSWNCIGHETPGHAPRGLTSTFWLQIAKCNLIAAIPAPKQQ